MTKIAFGSCMHGKRGSKQRVWNEAIAHEPEWLMLLGDNVYMDYALLSGSPKYWSLEKFAATMQSQYEAQFSISSFRRIVESIPAGQVVGVWDDHDFAWNNCNGADPSFDMAAKKSIATAFYHHYFEELNKRPLAAQFPTLAIDDLRNPPNGSKEIYRALDIGPVRVLLCDGRSWRRDHTAGTTDGSVLGIEQQTWLFDELRRGSGPFIIVSGSVMTASQDQSWDYFRNFFKSFLETVSDRLVIFLAGDIHENHLPPRADGHPIEIVSSGADLPPLLKRNFGVLDLNDGELSVFLYNHGKIEHKSKLDLRSGDYVTSMSLLADDRFEEISVEKASLQRQQALFELQAL